MLVKTTFNPAQVEDAAEKIFSAFRDNIHDTMASKLTVRRGALFGLLPARRSGPKELGIYIVTQSALIRLKTSLLIRERIENLINQWAQEASTTSPKLRWGTGFSSDGQKETGKIKSSSISAFFQMRRWVTSYSFLMCVTLMGV